MSYVLLVCGVLLTLLGRSAVRRPRGHRPLWVTAMAGGELAGWFLVLAGGPGLALGSWLHDVLRIPVFGDAYAVFGSLNRLFAAVGLLVLLVGIVLLILSLRIVRPTFDYDVGAPKKA